MIMSLRGAFAATKQSPVTRGDCSPAPPNRGGVATCARNDMLTASLRELQSSTGDELSALLRSVPDRAFKGEL
jgi:hypothetical protein